MKRLVSTFAAAVAIILASYPARASLRLCNRTSYVLYAATGTTTITDVTVQGWTRIVPGSCEIAIKGDLTAQGYYLYARSSRAHAGASRAWSGPVNICVKDADFTFRLPFGAIQCKDGYDLPFAAVDTHHMRSWTTTFREAPDFDSMRAAERAGLKRLLGDVGVRNLSNDKAVDSALAAFRNRMHLPAAAGAAALFNALETEAMRSAIPAGYTICNDTDGTVWAALGQRKDAAYVSRGWWTIEAGSCARAITDSIANRAIYLHVEKSKGGPLVYGPAQFCVTNIEFEIQGRGNCAKRGLTEAGFAETNTAGAAGFTAHIGENGLQGAGTSK